MPTRLRFWLLCLLLNLLFFLPIYLLNASSTPPVPQAALFDAGWEEGLRGIFLWRTNLDPWRISLEFSLLTALWIVVPWLQRRWVQRLFSGLYLITLAYYLYEAIVWSIYLAEPNFYSQYFLARDGIPFLMEGMQAAWWLYAAGAAGALLAVTALLWVLRRFWAAGMAGDLGNGTRWAFAVLAVAQLAALYLFQYYTAQPEMVVSSVGYKLYQNIGESIHLEADIASFDDSTAQHAYDYSSYALTKTPDIYLIFVESYGSVLYKRADYRQAYESLLAELEPRLEEAGWHARTALSESPMWGGGSWMAYSSALLGLRIDNQAQYLALRNKYQEEYYPNLGNTLRQFGYYAGYVSGMRDKWNDVQWAEYGHFLGADEWLRYEQMQYTGPHYGWGPGAPDQFTLNFADAHLQAATEQPLFFFTITQNSHFPWAENPELVADWRTLNGQQAGESVVVDKEDTAVLRQLYVESIDYQLQNMVDFVLSHGTDDSIFIFVGDHQPPSVSRRADGFGTPIHVIARDEALTDAFGEYGFMPGLVLKDFTPAVRHEGLYSLLMRILLQEYGDGAHPLPDYLADGAALPPDGTTSEPSAYGDPATYGNASAP